ncbi:hypothetical protein [Streptomyces sp. H27-D2]|uniref:hypothetical protein n=1 Tax=Streptomyces sp. H27-D2 TaxID=3046304 RepID=UPI002DBB32D7|nr:hypothetical protein [Streptomyces sp. H27-D2]MEC4016114.1 hypothetical protein [Streptomyces sp. H27-D2]
MAVPIEAARPEPGGSWTVDFADGDTQTIRADWIEPVGAWVEFRTTSEGLVALARTDATDCITYTPPAS